MRSIDSKTRVHSGAARQRFGGTARRAGAVAVLGLALGGTLGCQSEVAPPPQQSPPALDEIPVQSSGAKVGTPGSPAARDEASER